MKRKFFIIGYYGMRNVGDDAMLYALLQEFSSLDSENLFSVLSSIPLKIPSGLKCEVSYVRRSVFAVSKEILASSTIVIGGGTHLFDKGNKRKILNIQVKLFFLLSLAKILGKEIWLINNGLGPLKTKWGKILPNLICLMSNFISVRDSESYNYLANWGLAYKSSLAFDLAALLASPRDLYLNRNPDYNKKIIGISVTPVFEFYYGSKDRDTLLIEEISKNIGIWLREERNLEVKLFIFHGKSLKEDDISITKSLFNILKNQCPQSNITIVYYDPDPREILAQVARCNFFIGMRYHSCVFAYLCGLPLLIIDYQDKCRALAKEIGLPKNSVISLEEILTGKFGVYLRNMRKCPNDYTATLPIETAKKRAKKGFPDINSKGETR